MANVTINNVDSLNNDVLELKNKVNNSLKSNIDSINSTLNSIGNYSNNGFSVNIGDIAKSLKSNFDNGLTNITNATENIFNYASFINEFNVNDYDSSSKAIDLTDKYNNSYLKVVNNTDESKDKVSDTDTNNIDTSSDNSENSNSNPTTSTNNSESSNNNSSNSSNNSSNNSSSNNSKNNSNNSSSNNSKNNNNNNSSNNNQSNSETTTGPTIPSSVILMEDTEYSNNFDNNVLSIINNVTFDNEGFAKFENRYVVQMNQGFGKVGDYIDIMQNDGTTLNCIIGLTEESTTNNAINFFVNQNTFTKSVEELHPTWLKNIVSINNKGNYFNNVK